MRWHDALHPLLMQRVALLAPSERLRDLLVNVADEGTVAIGDAHSDADTPPAPSAASSRLQRLPDATTTAPALAREPLDLDRCERAGRVDLIAGEAQLEQRAAQALERGSVAALAGWMPAERVSHLAGRLAGLGGAVVPLPRPAGVQPPTLLTAEGPAREFAPLVETYATVPYEDLNPAVLAGVAYIVMFGIMFADVGHGALLVLAALAIRMRWSPRLARLRPAWLFLAGGGAASMAFGALYGEFFGPTTVIPVLWLAPLDHPVALLGAAVGAGGLLLAGAYALGSLNRFREGGWRRAVYAPSGLAGSAVFLGLAMLAAGLYRGLVWLAVLGGGVTVLGLSAAAVGLFTDAGGGGSAVAEAGIEVFDLVLRLGSNLVSFARLAAFGLTHAALGAVVWQASSAVWKHGSLGVIGAVAIFLVGNAVSFALEALVAAIQALRLEYYELFSRIFDIEGQAFVPWHVPLTNKEPPC
jgi:V/A-type H+-transporting ATPase subunit I